MKQTRLYASEHQKNLPAAQPVVFSQLLMTRLKILFTSNSHQMKQIYSSVHSAKILCLNWGKFHHIARIDLGKFDLEW